MACNFRTVYVDLLQIERRRQQVGAIHTYPVREIYTIVSDGRPTEVGLRGFPAVQTIIAAGAANQRSEAVLNMLFGDTVHGLDQLR